MRPLLLAAVLMTGTCLAQDAAPEPAAEVDMTNPTAVVEAYVRACAESDVEAALALLVDDPDLLPGLRFFLDEEGSMEGEGVGIGLLATLLAEYSLMPLGLVGGAAETEATQEGDSMIVSVTPVPLVQPQFVLVKTPEGEWRIDIEQTLKRTTGNEKSHLLTQVRQIEKARAAQGAAGAPPTAAQTEEARKAAQARREFQRQSYRRREQLSKLTMALARYAREMGGRLPEADVWMDALAEHILDGSIFRRPGAGEGEFGYAFNDKLSGEAIPNDWRQRERTILLYETADMSRNASGDPNEDLLPRDEVNLASFVGMAGGSAYAIPDGMTPGEAIMAWDETETCTRRLRALCKALLDYARDNEGLLPGADEWCDAIGPYLDPDNTDPEILVCPGAPEFECAWAINAHLAGKDVRTFINHDKYVLLMPSETGLPNEGATPSDSAVPGRHIQKWDTTYRKTVHRGRLDGSVQSVHEGSSYPMAPEAGD